MIKNSGSAYRHGGIEDGGSSIKAVHLDVQAKIPGADPAAFDTMAAGARAGCPVSKLFKADITMDAVLESQEPFPKGQRP